MVNIMTNNLNFNLVKTTEAASLFLQLHKGRMKYLMLLKLLYLLDREAFSRWERPVTYDTYASLPYGPILSKTYDIIRSSGENYGYWKKYIKTTSNAQVELTGNPPKIKKLSPAEIGLINELNAVYGKYDPFVLADKMHGLPEYKNPGKSSSPIPLEDLLSAVKYTPEDISRILQEMRAEAQIDNIFSTSDK